MAVHQHTYPVGHRSAAFAPPKPAWCVMASSIMPTISFS